MTVEVRQDLCKVAQLSPFNPDAAAMVERPLTMTCQPAIISAGPRERLGVELCAPYADMAEERCWNAVKIAREVVGATGDTALLVTRYKNSSADARAVTTSRSC